VRNRIWRARGRPRGNSHLRPDARALEYLIRLSMKHQIDPTEFFNAFVDAWKNGKTLCRGLTIQYRTKKNDSCVFLVTENHNVVAQFPIQEEVFKEPNPLDRFDFLRESINRVSVMKARKVPKSGHMHIEDLQVGMKAVSLKARVTEISKPKLVLTRLNGYALFANATISDKNSTIKVPLWNQRIHSVSVNDEVQVDNARVIMFRGEKQLRIGRNSKFRVVERNLPCAAESTVKCLIK